MLKWKNAVFSILKWNSEYITASTLNAKIFGNFYVERSCLVFSSCSSEFIRTARFFFGMFGSDKMGISWTCKIQTGSALAVTQIQQVLQRQRPGRALNPSTSENKALVSNAQFVRPLHTKYEWHCSDCQIQLHGSTETRLSSRLWRGPSPRHHLHPIYQWRLRLPSLLTNCQFPHRHPDPTLSFRCLSARIVITVILSSKQNWNPKKTRKRLRWTHKATTRLNIPFAWFTNLNRFEVWERVWDSSFI